MKIPKLSKKAIIIGLSVLGFLLFIGIFIALFPQLTYIASKVETVINDVVDENTENTSTDDTNIDDSVSEEYVSYDQYEDQIKLTSNDVKLVFVPKGFLTKETSPVSLFTSGDISKGTYDADDHSTHYEVGTVSGTIKVNDDNYTVPDGTKYYVAVYQTYWSGDNLYETKGWNDDSQYVRYFEFDGKIFVVNGNSFIDYAKTGTGVVISKTEDTDPTDDIDDSSEVKAQSILESNVIILNSEDFDFVTNCTFSLIDGTHYDFITTKGAEFILYTPDSNIIADLTQYTLIDDYKGLEIYVAKNMKFILIDREGFAQTLSLQTGLEDLDTKTYLWNDGTTSENTSYFSSYGTCESFSDATYGYVFENVTASNLIKVGTVDNKIIYEKKTQTTDAFTKKVYNEDYIATELWKHNVVTEDDTKPFTFAQYLTMHPVIYMRDVYGDLMRLTNENFFMIGGCAKPAIYLYPTQTTDISVKVVPNGKLTFTYPAYGDGWNVVANPNGNITNKADGKTYDYLWWDSYTYNLNEPQEGFVVKKTDISTFLDEKLSQMNLNTNEINEFKKYWIPKIQIEDSEYVFVTFLFNDQVNQIAKLDVVPQPENTFRVFMLYKSVTESYSVNPLNILKADRNGYTLVEWGGAKL